MYGINPHYKFPMLCAMVGSSCAASSVASQGDGQRHRVGGLPGILSIQPQYWGIYAIAMLVAIVVPAPADPAGHKRQQAAGSWIWPRPDPHNLGGALAPPFIVALFQLIRFQPMSEPTMTQTPWWQSAVIYQIYPKSFPGFRRPWHR